MRTLLVLVTLLGGVGGPKEKAVCAQQVTASSSLPESSPGGALNGDRFATCAGAAWQGQAESAGGWWWQVVFSSPHRIGSILQVNGQSGDVLACGPRDYIWQFSNDGDMWSDLKETHIVNEQRAFRVHRLEHAVEARWFRLRIDAATTVAEGPVLREIEFYPETDSRVTFPDWVLSVNITDRPASRDGLGHVDVLRAAVPDEKVLAQHVDVSSVTPEYVSVEPRPLCMFLSGSYRDWCEVDRGALPWSGADPGSAIVAHLGFVRWLPVAGDPR